MQVHDRESRGLLNATCAVERLFNVITTMVSLRQSSQLESSSILMAQALLSGELQLVFTIAEAPRFDAADHEAGELGSGSWYGAS